jgi:hypothetical protein
MTDVAATPAYRPAVITFLDILGFRERVGRSDNPEAIRRILTRLRSFAARRDALAPEDPADAPEGIEMTHSIAFSDSIVRIRFFDTEYPTGALFHEVLSLLQAQGELVADDVLLRGGVTVGLVHLEGDMAFGPGFIRAYDLESQFANYPRIVIGPEAFAALRNDPRLVADHHDLEDEVHYQRQMLRRSEDGFWFIDYLYGMREEMDYPEQHPDLVAQHRAFIIDGANGAPANSRVLQKFLWLARYLNDVADRAGLPQLLITQGDIPALEELAERPPWADGEEPFRDI